ncbi:hypothetical protein MH928_10125 [Flavobacterium sp. WW92]|uniref:hypothetical protein n=1 Tax=unclassified Flavobacterium TaxID=196869 RepID=UPI0022250A2C|nr:MULTISPECIES: hypothetical protein [unclassified Flavobacterium]WDO11688.1 hypothetical protein MH928_10125 [Flavobacterium sp. WW92]
MYKSLILLVSFIALSCNNDKNIDKKVNDEIVKVSNFNIIIAPDLSNRIDPKIHPKPVHDTIIINNIFEQIPDILKFGGRSAHQKDIFTFDFINAGILNSSNFEASNFQINFSQFENNQLERSDYIRNNLKKDILTAKQNIKAVYDKSIKDLHGSDIYNYLNSTVNNILVSEEPTIINLDNLNVEISTKNIIVLFTDGYIENATEDSGYQFSEATVNKIRKQFISQQSKDLNSFITDNPQFQINRLTNKNLKDCRIIVVEMVDRSLDSNGVARKLPTDFDIMRAVWENWFKQSNIAEYEIVKSQNTYNQVISQITKFINKQASKKSNTLHEEIN